MTAPRDETEPLTVEETLQRLGALQDDAAAGGFPEVVEELARIAATLRQLSAENEQFKRNISDDQCAKRELVDMGFGSERLNALRPVPAPIGTGTNNMREWGRVLHAPDAFGDDLYESETKLRSALAGASVGNEGSGRGDLTGEQAPTAEVPAPSRPVPTPGSGSFSGGTGSRPDAPPAGGPMTDTTQIERERAIAEKAWRRGATGSPTGSMALSQEEMLRTYLDREYPLPPPEPRIVTGRSGTEFKWENDTFWARQALDGRTTAKNAVFWSGETVQQDDRHAAALALLGPEGAADLFERMTTIVWPGSANSLATRARAVAAYEELVKEAAR